MAKKRQKTRKHSATQKRQPVLTPDALEKKARELFAAKKYREASEYGKKLLQEEKRPEWLDLLADIYSHRAEELATKGMHKEAIMIWRNRSELCGKPMVAAFYVETLLAGGMTEKILALYQHEMITLERAGCLGIVREHLAALSLHSPNEVIKKLAADDVLIKECPTALAALEAYCAGNDDTLQDLLKTISFRSPFRDLKLILKALSLPENDTSAATLLSKIASTSPFARLAEAISLSQKPEISLFSGLSELAPETAQFVIAKKGFTNTLLNFYEELRKLGDSPLPAALVRFISRHHEVIGTQLARAFALKLLAQVPSGNPAFNKTFGKPTALELAQTEALKIELRKGDPMDSVRAWEEVESTRSAEEGGAANTHQLSHALIGRRKLQHIDEIEHYGKLDDAIDRLLEWVLQNDPKDHAGYLRLIASYRKRGKLKDARLILEKAKSNFPGDIAILTEAVETALAGKAYKKAALLGKQILEKDPINTRVRTALIHAHLLHARKLMDNQKYELAEKELDIAGSWGKTPEDKARVELVRGTLRLDQRLIAEATDIWVTAIATLGGGLCGHFHLLLELLNQSRSAGAALKKTGVTLSGKPVTEKQLLAFFRLLSSFEKNKQSKQIDQALSLLASPLEKAAKLSLSSSDFEMICETLNRFNRDSLSLRYAKAARKHWPKELAFIYYIIAAETATDDYLSKTNFDRLEVLIADAEAGKQNKLKHRAISLINSASMPPDDFGFGGFDMSTPPDIDSVIELLLQSMPSELVKNMKREMGEKEFYAYLRAMVTSDMPPDLLDMMEAL